MVHIKLYDSSQCYSIVYQSFLTGFANYLFETFFTFRWFKQWNLKMDSEKKQREQKKTMVGENLASEFVPMEHHEKRGNKTVTVMKETPYAYVADIKKKVLDFLDGSFR